MHEEVGMNTTNTRYMKINKMDTIREITLSHCTRKSSINYRPRLASHFCGPRVDQPWPEAMVIFYTGILFICALTVAWSWRNTNDLDYSTIDTTYTCLFMRKRVRARSFICFKAQDRIRSVKIWTRFE